MFLSLKRLWDSGKLDEVTLRRAVADKGWITPQQFTEITGIEYE